MESKYEVNRLETLESKYSSFEKQILSEAESQVQQITDEAKVQCEKLRTTKLKEIDVKVDNIIAEAHKKEQQYKNAAVSRAKIERNKILLQKREEFIDRLMEEIAAEMSKYAQSQAYQQQLKLKLSETLKEIKEISIDLYLVERDHLLFKKWEKELRAVFSGEIVLKTLSDDLIGGFAIRNQLKGLYIDEALVHQLEELRSEVAHALIRKMS